MPNVTLYALCGNKNGRKTKNIYSCPCMYSRLLSRKRLNQEYWKKKVRKDLKNRKMNEIGQKGGGSQEKVKCWMHE